MLVRPERVLLSEEKTKDAFPDQSALLATPEKRQELSRMGVSDSKISAHL